VKQLTPKPSSNRSKAAAMAFGLHAVSRLLMFTGWAIHLVARFAYRLATTAERAAQRIKAR